MRSDVNAEKIKSLCTKYGVQPSKERGQNFLIDEWFVNVAVDAADLTSDDSVVEVGPGFGVLTKELVKRVHKVVAVEVDKRMYEAATDILARYKNLEIVHEDILKVSNERLVEALHNSPPPPQSSPLKGEEAKRNSPPLVGGVRGGGDYKLVANLPYSITSAVLRKFTEHEPKPTLIVLMVQKEVAERVCAKPGAMSVLSVAVQYYARPEIVAFVPRSAFWPEPEVESAILRITITPSQSPPYTKGEKIGVDEKRLFQVVRIGFSSRRKQLQNNLSAGLKILREMAVGAILKAGLDPKVRAQELSVENWIALAKLL